MLETGAYTFTGGVYGYRNLLDEYVELLKGSAEKTGES